MLLSYSKIADLRNLIIFIFLLFNGGSHFHPVSGYPGFKSKIPNGNKFLHAGHASKPSLPNVNHNQFGKDFEANGFKYDAVLCAKDSDNDGFTNGQELGDPNCSWVEGGVPTCTSCPMHPGDASEAGMCGSKSGCVLEIDEIRDKHMIHGWIMMITWLFLVPLMIVIALLRRTIINLENNASSAAASADSSDSKSNFIRKMVPYLPMLMMTHKIVMAIVIILTFVGLYFTFTATDEAGALSNSDSHNNTHALLGIIVTALACIQPLIWLYMQREMSTIASQNGGQLPTNPTLTPTISRLSHRIIGTIALVIGVITTFLGQEAYSYLYPDESNPFKSLAIVLIIFFGTLYAGLQGYTTLLTTRGPVTSNSNSKSDYSKDNSGPGESSPKIDDSSHGPNVEPEKVPNQSESDNPGFTKLELVEPTQ